MFVEGATKTGGWTLQLLELLKRCDGSLMGVIERALAEGLGVGRWERLPRRY